MKILVSEYFSSGALSRSSLTTHLLVEGYAMAYFLAIDLFASKIDVTLTLDYRLSPSHTELGLKIVKITPNEDYMKKIIELANHFDYTVIIAPSQNNILAKILTILEDRGISLINSKSATVSKVANKYYVYKVLKTKNINVPLSEVAQSNDINRIRKIAKDLGFPVVIKPICSDGSEDVFLIRTRNHLSSVLDHIKNLPNREILIQEFVCGIPASLSLLVNKSGKTVVMSINKQNILIDSTSGKMTYIGGHTPVCYVNDEIKKLANLIVKSFSGLKGYVGIDIIINRDGIYVIEVNPRLTTSYVGLRRVLNENVGLQLVRFVADSNFKPAINYKNEICAFRVLRSTRRLQLTRKLLNIVDQETLLIPPVVGLTVQKGDPVGLVMVSESSLHRAYTKIYRIKRDLQRLGG